MAYSTANLPFLMTPGPIASYNSTAMAAITPRLWGYVSTADNLATVVGSSYFSNGYTIGLRKYDSILFTDVGSTLTSIVTITSQTSSGNDPRGVTAASMLTS